jgi:hypothetical protein
MEVPESNEPEAANPDQSSDKIIRRSCRNAGLLSVGLSLPTGPLGLITLLPDLTGVWKIQRQMVADIASAYGERGQLNREQMLFFLFRHSVTHLFADVVTKSGERYVVRRLSGKTFESVIERLAARIGSNLTLRASKIALPVLGAAFLGSYSYLDTLNVGLTAKKFFALKTAQEKGLLKVNGERVLNVRVVSDRPA